MSNYGVKVPKWNPNRAEMDVFQEWKKITIQHLVSCKKGILPYKLPGMLQERVDERLPLDKMGLECRNVNHFLYQLRNDIILRKVDGKLYVFINESSVPSAMSHIRQMVLGQKGKDDKPLRHHGMGVQADELLRFQPRPPVSAPSSYNPGYQNRAPRGRSSSGPSNSNGRRGPPAQPRSGISPFRPIQSNVSKATLAGTSTSSGFGNAASRRMPRVDSLADNDNWNVSKSAPRPGTSRAPQPTTFRRFLPGVVDNDSSSDSGEFDFYSGPRKSPPLPLFAANKTLTLATQEEKKTVTAPEEKKTSEATSATVVSQPQNVVHGNAPSASSVSMQSNLPLTDTAPKQKLWGRSQLMSRMKDMMERYGDPNKEVEVTVSESNIAASNSSQTESGCNAPKISEEPSSSSVKRRCRSLPMATPSTKQLPDWPDMEVNYGYTVEDYSGQNHFYQRGLSGVQTFKQVVKFPSYLIDPPRTLKGFLEKTGQLKNYMKSMNGMQS